MKTIKCRICGSEIDASLGVCPYCGTVFYVMEEPAGAEPEPKQPPRPAHNTDDILNADNDELFNTRVWKTGDPDSTRVFDGQPAQQQYRQPAQQSQYRQPVQQQYRQPVQQPQYRQPDAPPPKNNKKKLIIVTCVALAAVVVLLIAIMSGAFNFNKNGGQSTMPNVLNSSQEAATAILEKLGMVVRIDTRESDGAAGIVLEQSIAEGVNVIEGQQVTLTVSASKETEEDKKEVEVIDVTGKKYEDAYKLLTDKNLRVTRAEDAYDDTVPEGYVVKQSPLKGAKLQEGDIVTLTVSKGEEPVKEHTVTVTAGTGGSVSPNGAVKVEDGQSATFSITPNAGYEISQIKVDGAEVPVNSSITMGNVTADHSLYVVFREVATPTPPPATTPPVETPVTENPAQ